MEERPPDEPEAPLPVDAPPPAEPQPRAKAPRVGESISGAFDLALAASRQVRRASLYVGVLTLALVGPAIVLFMVLVRDQGGFGGAIDLLNRPPGRFEPFEQNAISMLWISLFVGVAGVLVILIEAQIMVAAIVGGVATGRSIGIRGSLRLSRRVFWRVLGASSLVLILQIAVSLLVSWILSPDTIAELEAAQIVALIAQTVVAAPFIYSLAGIVVGGVGPIESLKRSVRVSTARWRLAFLLAAVGALIAFVQDFALGAGFDLLARIATTAGLGVEGSVAAALVTGVLILAAVMAVGSLLVTVTALIVAFQIVVFLRMTGYSAGLDRAVGGGFDDDLRAPKLLAWPMRILIGFGILFAILGLTSL